MGGGEGEEREDGEGEGEGRIGWGRGRGGEDRVGEGKGRRGRMGWNEYKHSSLSSVVKGVVTLRQVTAVVTSQSCFAVTLGTQCDTCTWM